MMQSGPPARLGRSSAEGLPGPGGAGLAELLLVVGGLGGGGGTWRTPSCLEGQKLDL